MDGKDMNYNWALSRSYSLATVTRKCSINEVSSFAVQIEQTRAHHLGWSMIKDTWLVQWARSDVAIVT